MNFLIILAVGIGLYFVGAILFNRVAKRFFGNVSPLSFFKKKKIVNPKEESELKEALNQGLITEEEFYRLKIDRAETELKKFLSDRKK